MLLSKNHLKTRFTASTDESRPVLTTIDLKVEGDEVVAVATNGYILSEVREQTPVDDDFPEVGQVPAVSVGRTSAKTAAAVSSAIKKNKLLPVLNYAQVSTDSITVTDLEQTHHFKDRPVEGNFPDYKQLLPASEDALAVVKINPEYLATMGKLFKGEHTVTLELHGKGKAVVMRSEQDGHIITGVIMPLRE